MAAEPQAKEIRIPRTAAGTRRVMRRLEAIAELREKTADRLGSAVWEAEPGVEAERDYTHTQSNAALWRRMFSVRHNSKEAGIGIAGLNAILGLIAAPIHTAGMVVIATNSAMRASELDPELYYKYVAGTITFSRLDASGKLRLAKEVADSLRLEAVKYRGLHADLEKYYDARFSGQIKAAKRKKEWKQATAAQRKEIYMAGAEARRKAIGQIDAANIRQRFAAGSFRLTGSANARAILENSLDGVKNAEKLIETLREHEPNIVNDGDYFKALAANPGLVAFERHLDKVTSAETPEQRKVRLDGLVGRLEEVRKTHEANAKAVEELAHMLQENGNGT